MCCSPAVGASARVRVGTSGWVYTHWRGRFYPDGLPARAWLSYYGERFRTVEINSSFYRLPELSTLETWRDATPSGFTFAFKASRFLTHMKKLTDPAEPIARMLERAGALGDKLGPILFQLPGRFRVNPVRLAEFLDRLPEGLRPAFEFRDPSWASEEVYGVLRRHSAAWCIWHLAGVEAPKVLTADHVYVRLHGPGGKYEGSYDDQALDRWAESIAGWATDGREVYCYFDNDQNAFATRDAARLVARLEKC